MRDMILRFLNTPPPPPKKKMNITKTAWLISAIIALPLALGISWGVGNKMGFKEGMKTYHQICYQISGPMLDKEDGTVVYCMPLAAIPEEEMNKHRQQELDNKNKVWYNNN